MNTETAVNVVKEIDLSNRKIVRKIKRLSLIVAKSKEKRVNPKLLQRDRRYIIHKTS